MNFGRCEVEGYVRLLQVLRTSGEIIPGHAEADEALGGLHPVQKEAVRIHLERRVNISEVKFSSRAEILIRTISVNTAPTWLLLISGDLNKNTIYQ